MKELTYEPEKQRATHLLVLLVCTILIIVLTGESLLLGWETVGVVLLLLGLVACWVIHITEKIPELHSVHAGIFLLRDSRNQYV